jgi:hypothetical protein
MELQSITKKLYRWSEKHGRPGTQYEWHSYALTIRPDLILLIDPLAPSAAVCQELEALGIPTHILLTCLWHTRAAEALRQRWGCKVLLNENGVARSEMEVDETFQPPCRLWDRIDLLPLGRLSWPEEVAVRFEQHLLVMDGLVGGRADLQIAEGEVGIHPNRFAMGHIPDMNRARELILELAEPPLKEMHFGHGAPVRQNAAAALRKLANARWMPCRVPGQTT